MKVWLLIDQLQKLNRPNDEVYVSYDCDNASGQVQEVYVTTEDDCCRAMLVKDVVTLRI